MAVVGRVIGSGQPLALVSDAAPAIFLNGEVLYEPYNPKLPWRYTLRVSRLAGGTFYRKVDFSAPFTLQTNVATVPRTIVVGAELPFRFSAVR